VGAPQEHQAMTDDPLIHQCCFCDQAIDESDTAAVLITLSSLWARVEAAQSMFSHSACAQERLTAILSPAVPLDIEMFDD
jgi:hypothetical protein